MTFIWIALGLAIFALLIFTQSAQAAQRCDFVVELVSVEGIPDDAKPGDIFRTTWLLRDKNGCGWPSGLQLLFADGNRMSGPSALSLRSPARGQDLKISFDLKAPEEIDDHYGSWQLAIEGRVIGPVLDVDLKVVTRTQEDPVPDLPHTVPTPETYLETGEWADLPAESIAEASVQCPDGVVTGGGWTVTGGSYGPRVYRSVMEDNGWSVSARNDSDHDIELRAYAICLHNIPDGVVTLEIDEWIDISSHDVDGASAYCPEWGVRTGGGFDVFAYNNMEMRMVNPDTENGWFLQAHNGSFVDESARVTVICLIGLDGAFASLIAGDSTMLAPMDEVVPSGYVEATCPEDSEASGGAMGYAGFIYFESMLEYETWYVRAFNPFGVEAQFATSVVCLNIP